MVFINIFIYLLIDIEVILILNESNELSFTIPTNSLHINPILFFTKSIVMQSSKTIQQIMLFRTTVINI